jgi:hypothetical protein
MGGAFCAALCLGALVIAVDGADRKGIDAALFVTGRLNFLLFWPAYAGSALVSLFGDSFAPLRRRGREFGLAFASALLVHLGFVAWLCAIGDAPERSTFIFFGVATAFVYMIALFSIRRLQLALGDRGWRLLRTIGMNYIAYTFAVDFLDDPPSWPSPAPPCGLPLSCAASARHGAWPSRPRQVRATGLILTRRSVRMPVRHPITMNAATIARSAPASTDLHTIGAIKDSNLARQTASNPA